MRRYTTFVVLVMFAGLAVAQEARAVHVCVAVMQNAAGRSVNSKLERDRLTRALNQLKQDKKSRLTLRAVPLEGSTASRQEVDAKNCDYFVYTTLTELRGAGDPYQHRPGTIETNPDSQFGRGQPGEQEFRATVEFRLVRASDASELSGAPYSTQQAMPEADVVSQVMDRIANNVWSEIKKDAPPR